jgi:prefoldin subunit 5
MRETDRELQRHVQSLLHLKNRLRRAHDALGKEYSSISQALKDVVASCHELSDDLERTRVAHQSTGADGVLAKHAQLVHDHLGTLQALGTEARDSLSGISLTDRELQHLMVLVDRATDIDMQCLDGTVPDAVITNGSPLFPHLTINDSDAAVDKASNLTAKASRIAHGLRRALTTARGEVSHSAHQFEQNLHTAARINAEAAHGAGRQLEGLRYDLGRLQKHKSALLEEMEAVDARHGQVTRTITLRETAKDAIFSKTGVDPVIPVLRKEASELAQRRSDLDQQLHAINAQIERSQHETAAASDQAAVAMHRVDSFSLAASTRAGSSFSRRGAAGATGGGALSPSASFVGSGPTTSRSFVATAGAASRSLSPTASFRTYGQLPSRSGPEREAAPRLAASGTPVWPSAANSPLTPAGSARPRATTPHRA